MARDQRATGGPGQVTSDLDNHLEGRSGCPGEEENAEEVGGEVTADPGADDRRASGDQGKDGQAGDSDRGAALLGDRRGDAEPLRDVMDHEADDQKRAEGELPEG